MAPCLSVVFRLLVRLGSLTACWRQVNVNPIPKSPASSSVANYRPFSITSVLSKVFEPLVSVCLGRFMEGSGVLPTTLFAYRKGLGTCDALLCLPHTLQSALESVQEARILQIDFSEALDKVNHQGILYKLCSVGIGGSLLSILIHFLSNRLQHVMVYDRRSKMVNVVFCRVNLYSPLSVSVERSCWPCIWWCGTGRFQELGQCFFIGLLCPILSSTIFSFSFFCP